MNDKVKNFYLQIGIQRASDVEAIGLAAELASASNEFVEVRECGTKRLICRVSPEGNLLTEKQAE